MNDLLQSLRSDLLSRRLLPFVALALLVLVVAVGYALGGAGSSVAPHAAPPPSAPAQQAALAVTAAAPNPNAAESETPGGLRYQAGGATRNPFTPLPEPKTAAAKTAASTSSSTSSSKSSAGGSSGTPGGAGAGKSSGTEPGPTPPKPASPSKPATKPSFPYDVSILFGKLPATAGQAVTLPPYQNLQPQRPLPSASDARIALARVSGNAKSVVFALLAPPILRGPGLCLPSPSECHQLGLAPGQAEELEYIEEDGQALVYELKTVSIVKSSSQAAG